jgi:hypothetical protein
MTPYDFHRACSSNDAETVCHAVFDEAHLKWTMQGHSSLTEGEKTVLCVETFFGETLNGGLDQYLGNESGLLAQYGSVSLRRVGLDKYARILDKTLARCIATKEEGHGDEIATRYELPDSEEELEALEELEKEFFDLYFADELEFRRQLLSYVLNNEDQFVYPD